MCYVDRPETPIESVECGLLYCVNKYLTNMTNNKVFEQSIFQPVARSAQSWQTTPEHQLNGSLLASLEYDPIVSKVPRTDLMLGDGYNISNSAVIGISDFFQQNFWRTTSDRNDSYEFVDGYLISPLEYSPNSMQPLYNSPDLFDTFEAIAVSMSNTLRVESDDTPRWTGMKGTSVTLYRIQWAWIALPVAVVVVSILQLMITMQRTECGPLLKSSTLATLSRGRYVSELLRGAETILQLRDAASPHDVRLFDAVKELQGMDLRWNDTGAYKADKVNRAAKDA